MKHRTDTRIGKWVFPAKQATCLTYTNQPLLNSALHVMPIAKGGTHTLANVKLAHLTCNQRKSDKV